ncbi:MAG: CHAT domain-containing protein [bacterium]|nr:CHAT domain-containing protein [bacterium]
MTRLSHLQTRLIEAKSKPAANEDLIAQLGGLLDQAERDRRELEEEIRRRHPRYASLQYPQPLGLTAIQALLDSETALLEYTLGEEASTLFVVTREGLTTYPLASSAEEISVLVDEMRGFLGRPGHSVRSKFDRAAHKLYQLLIAPAEPVIADKTRLLIAPDAALYSLSFEVLLPRRFSAPRFQGLDYLLRRWSVTYVPSASVLACLEEPPRTGAASDSALAFLGFGDPLYRLGAAGDAPAKWPADRSGDAEVRSFFTDSERWDMSRLKNSAREVSEISQLFDPEEVKIFLRGEATEENAKSEVYMRHARLIHFATHGVISEQQPQLSGLVLTLDEDPAEDGLLQVYEIFNLKINADLVVLSACETGLGKEVRGEGLIGLSRAFMYAGTPSVVVSLWQVADGSTADLMVRFYGHLAQGIDKTESLRRAKLELLDEGRFAHPYYWAPFILIGKP